MDYFVFVLGYDLLHDVLDGLYCDVAYELCTEVYNDFCKSAHNNYDYSEYECLSRYVKAYMDEIKAKVEELR